MFKKIFHNEETRKDVCLFRINFEAVKKGEIQGFSFFYIFSTP
jgi:hypothetical protein